MSKILNPRAFSGKKSSLYVIRNLFQDLARPLPLSSARNKSTLTATARSRVGIRDDEEGIPWFVAI
ncbi:MAG: hypothetical protein R3281_04410 [Balneolaceae bacterium]|nr:hypothetical protein [Balneolaceae bacterium]